MFLGQCPTFWLLYYAVLVVDKSMSLQETTYMHQTTGATWAKDTNYLEMIYLSTIELFVPNMFPLAACNNFNTRTTAIPRHPAALWYPKETHVLQVEKAL